MQEEDPTSLLCWSLMKDVKVQFENLMVDDLVGDLHLTAEREVASSNVSLNVALDESI